MYVYTAAAPGSDWRCTATVSRGAGRGRKNMSGQAGRLENWGTESGMGWGTVW